MVGESVYDIAVGACACFSAQPAVSLNNPTCLGPAVIHSRSGNLQYHGKIKRSVGRVELGGWEGSKRHNLVDSAYWAPDSSYQPVAALLTGCVQRGRVREELHRVL